MMLFRPALVVMTVAAMLCGRSPLFGQAAPDSSIPLTLAQAETAALANQPADARRAATGTLFCGKGFVKRALDINRQSLSMPREFA